MRSEVRWNSRHLFCHLDPECGFSSWKDTPPTAQMRRPCLGSVQNGSLALPVLFVVPVSGVSVLC